MNKVLQIVTDIGRQPVLSFGNSSGDVSMHNYTIMNNVYPSAAFMLTRTNPSDGKPSPAFGISAAKASGARHSPRDADRKAV